MSIFSEQFYVFPVRDGGFVIRLQNYNSFQNGHTTGANDTYAFTCLQDMLDFFADQATAFRVLPTKDDANKLK